jgi:predicted dehydrogenase
MNAAMNRRTFLQTTTAAGLALAASPTRALAADGRIGLAFVGCAHIHTPGFVNLLKGRPDVQVKYAWDPQPARAEKRAEELGARSVASLDDIWNDPGIAAVVICSETNRHRELVEAAARSGKQMFVEKPLGISAAESRAMARLIEDAGLLFTTGYFMRTDPKHLFLKEQVAQGAFGTLTRVSAWNCHSGSLGGWFDEKPDDPANSWRWMADVKQAGVGGFGDLGTHSLDILMWIFGDVDSVSADIRVVTGRYGPKTDETGQALIKFENGAMGSLTAGWLDVLNPRHGGLCLDRQRPALLQEQQGSGRQGRPAVDGPSGRAAGAASPVRGRGGRAAGSAARHPARGRRARGRDGGDVPVGAAAQVGGRVGPASSVAEIHEVERDGEIVAADGGDYGLEIVAALAGHAQFFGLDLDGDLELEVADEAADLLGDGRVEALLDADQLAGVPQRGDLGVLAFDVLQADGALGDPPDDDLLDRLQFERVLGAEFDLVLLEHDLRRAALEVEPAGQFLLRLVDGVLDLHRVDPGHDVEARHGRSVTALAAGEQPAERWAALLRNVLHRFGVSKPVRDRAKA